jgi:hypothetical protein
MYSFITNDAGSICFIRKGTDSFIPLDITNRDCAQFLVDWQNGVSVTNADDSNAAYSDASARALGLIT